MLIGRIDRISDHTTESKHSRAERKLYGLLFSIIIALAPILIVALSPPRMGGTFVAGYLVGAITAPFVVFGAVRVADDLFEASWLNSAFGVLIYLTVVILLSVSAIVWSFYFAMS